ncbi:hypothetical protein VTH8203_03420 [Vibrio thalassae]|uniref:Uncharacterized protein n=1 Tax=Vibrio thalassae TaxID=1243014 RepID=A0A240EM53_9VIBR|nr:lysylphosphatidylglycerol synthase transmembrane domain-containing protein [Vibrio thalassae]SNX49772.1 hypothetical protein VTH8203_03420 [Vibrio thalassae]
MKKKLTNKKSFIYAFIFISLFYISVILVLEQQFRLELLKKINYQNIVVVVLLFLVSIFVRYFRWHLIMKNNGEDHCFFRGLFFYVSGFAFTASPGKIGELSRVIHYRAIGVSSDVVISSFIIERFFDLIVVLVLASVLLVNFSSLKLVAVVIIFMITVVVLLANNLTLTKSICRFFVNKNYFNTRRLFLLVYKVFCNVNYGLETKSFLVYMLLGTMAWCSTSFILVYLSYIFDIQVNGLDLMAVYPAAMLSGAVSFIPGGVGATEAVIVIILNHWGVSLTVATTIALIVRFSTLWLAMFVGIICTIISSLFLKQDNI